MLQQNFAIMQVKASMSCLRYLKSKVRHIHKNNLSVMPEIIFFKSASGLQTEAQKEFEAPHCW